MLRILCRIGLSNHAKVAFSISRMHFGMGISGPNNVLWPSVKLCYRPVSKITFSFVQAFPGSVLVRRGNRKMPIAQVIPRHTTISTKF